MDRLRTLATECGVESLDFMHGVFCAAATPANRQDPTEWLPLLLREPPESRATLVEFSRLCFTEYAICAELLDLGEPHVPEAEDLAGVRSFCRGYMLVARADTRWFNTQPVFLATLPLAALADLAPVSSLEPFFPEAASDPNWLEQMRQTLSDRVVNISRDFRAAVPYQANLAKAEKIGRNEPCPCGSGRKYKKCCFSAN
jgi:uncharacterized protein YecA (UPF0149 family)